jgi:hypothetical protein
MHQRLGGIVGCWAVRLRQIAAMAGWNPMHQRLGGCGLLGRPSWADRSNSWMEPHAPAASMHQRLGGCGLLGRPSWADRRNSWMEPHAPAAWWMWVVGQIASMAGWNPMHQRLGGCGLLGLLSVLGRSQQWLDGTECGIFFWHLAFPIFFSDFFFEFGIFFLEFGNLRLLLAKQIFLMFTSSRKNICVLVRLEFPGIGVISTTGMVVFRSVKLSCAVPPSSDGAIHNFH